MFSSSEISTGLSGGTLAAIIGLSVLVLELSLWGIFAALRKRRTQQTK